MNKLAWLLLLLSELTQNPVGQWQSASAAQHGRRCLDLAGHCVVVRQQNARPPCVGAATGRWRVFFYLITLPNVSNASVWETWNHVAVSAATLLASMWLARKK